MSGILVTGAAGSVGRELCQQFSHVHATDVAWEDRHLDVTDAREVDHWLRVIEPEIVYHLAGAKHAPDGELDPAHVARVNIDGTLNVLRGARSVGAMVVMTSTCKACDPETAYGASKLIAERAVMNECGVVVRFHNIPESSGNVFRLWESLDEDEPLPVTDCWRYFTPMEKAVDLLLKAPTFPTGRYAVDPGIPEWIPNVASALYPGREQVTIDRRRGDRRREPLHAACEDIYRHGEFLCIVGAHDPVGYELAA